MNFDLTSIGAGFAPTDQNLQDAGQRGGGLLPSPEAIRTLSLRLPRFAGGMPPAGAGAPGALLQSAGLGGMGGGDLLAFLQMILGGQAGPMAGMTPRVNIIRDPSRTPPIGPAPLPTGPVPGPPDYGYGDPPLPPGLPMPDLSQGPPRPPGPSRIPVRGGGPRYE